MPIKLAAKSVSITGLNTVFLTRYIRTCFLAIMTFVPNLEPFFDLGALPALADDDSLAWDTNGDLHLFLNDRLDIDDTFNCNIHIGSDILNDRSITARSILWFRRGCTPAVLSTNPAL